MNTRFIFIALVIFISGMGFSQPQLSFRLTNPGFSQEPYPVFSFDVEIMADQAGTFHRDLQLYINFNAEAFGENIVANNNVTCTPLGLMNDHYSIVNFTDNSFSTFAIITEAIEELYQIGNYSAFNEVSTDYLGLFHIEIKVSNADVPHEVDFDELLMNGGQFFQDTLTTAPFLYATENNYSNEIYDFQMIGQKIIIPQGWSGISSFMNADTDNIETLFAPILTNLIILQNSSGMYWPGQNVNTLGVWNTYEGYQIKVADDVELSISGTRTLDRSLALENGWNLIPVLSECNADIADIFAGSNVIIVKEVAGWRVYWPEFGIHTLQVLEPGKAYFVLMEAGEVIVFPECDGLKDGQNLTGLHPARAGLSGLIPWQISKPSAITLTIAIPALAVSEIQRGDVIGAFDESGKCYGLALWVNKNTSITLFGDDPTTIVKDGFAEGELLNFKLIENESGQEHNLEVVFDESLPNADYRFHNNGLSALASLKVSATGFGNLSSLARPQIIPNPAKDEFILKLANVGQIDGTMRILALDGRPMGEYKIQYTETSIDVSSLKAGVYLLEINVNDTSFVERLIKY